MTHPRENNYAFIDTQNLICGVERYGWLVDFEKLRRYLFDKYRVTKAFLFVGYVEKFSRSYAFLETIGYEVCYKPVVMDEFGKPKANIDADLVLKAILEKDNYTKAVIMTGDGDFYSLVEHLLIEEKLETVICPSIHICSSLLKRAAQGRIIDLSGCRAQISRTPHK